MILIFGGNFGISVSNPEINGSTSDLIFLGLLSSMLILTSGIIAIFYLLWDSKVKYPKALFLIPNIIILTSIFIAFIAFVNFINGINYFYSSGTASSVSGGDAYYLGLGPGIFISSILLLISGILTSLRLFQRS